MEEQARKSFEEVMRGTNRCALTFCVLPNYEGLMELLREHQFYFNTEFGKLERKMMLSVDIPLNMASYICEKYDLGGFVLVRMSEIGLSSEVYAQAISDRFSFRDKDKKYVLAETIQEEPYHKCLRNGNIIINGNLSDIRIPIAIYKEIVGRMDNMVSERKSKYQRYAERFEQELKYSLADWGNYLHQRHIRALLFGRNYYISFENEAKWEQKYKQ